LQGHHPYTAAIAAMHATMKALRDGVAPEDLTGLAPASLMKQVTRAAGYESDIDAYLGTGPT
jgi:carboxyvinyl-carboxyphosphonate phosphorylmutase